LKLRKRLILKLHQLLKVTNFKKNYRNCVVEINKLDISSRISILKANNGTGKTTLFKAVFDLIKYEGEIVVKSKNIAYLMENPIFPDHLSIECFIKLISDNNDKSLMFLRMFDMEGKIKEKICNLSKGMRQKLNLVIILSLDKDIFLLDEPFDGLDDDSIMYLVKYFEEDKKVYIIIDHQNVNIKGASYLGFT